MRTVLVSGASGIVGYGILRSLRVSGLDLNLVGATMYDDSVAQAFCDVFVQAPPTNDPKYMSWLLDTIARHKIELIIPGIEIDMYKWIDHLSEIQARGAKVLMNDEALIRACQDKWGFYESLRSAGIACAIESTLDADFGELGSRFGLPFLLKPRRGFGSKGIARISTEADFLIHRQHMGTVLMAQPIVGSDDEEYTTSAFCDGAGGLFACMTLRRKLSREGFTDKAEVVRSDEFLETIQTLCRHFRPLGPTNFQFRKCIGNIKLLEINPRISSSTSIRTAFGYNESAMAIEYLFEGKLPVQPVIRSGKAVRYTEDHIFYEDSIHL